MFFEDNSGFGIGEQISLDVAFDKVRKRALSIERSQSSTAKLRQLCG